MGRSPVSQSVGGSRFHGPHSPPHPHPHRTRLNHWLGRHLEDLLVGADRDYHRHVAEAVRSDPPGAEAPAGERYLLLADISGYTRFMAGVEAEHGIDFSNGIPAAYPILADLLDSVVEGVKADLALVKLEGDAVFAAAPAAGLDGR